MTGFELAHPNIHSIYVLLEREGTGPKEPWPQDLQDWGSSRIPERSFRAGPVRTDQKPTPHCTENLQIKLFGQRGTPCDTLQLPRPLQPKNLGWRGGREGRIFLIFPFAGEATSVEGRCASSEE